MTHQIVIVGGGFGGLELARSLRTADVDITLIDRRNFHLFQPLLYQVATGALSPANIAAPLRAVLKNQKNVTVLMEEVIDFDVENRQVILADRSIPYDTLVVAAGVRHSYFGHPTWETFAPGLKTIEDATEIRRKVLWAFEAAERETNPSRIEQWLTFVVVGGGPTGVELAGAVGEIANYTLRNNFRHIDPSHAKVILIEGMDRILLSYVPSIAAKAVTALQKLGVEVRTKTSVTDVGATHVTVSSNGETSKIPTHTVLWAAGVQASTLAAKLAEKTGAETDRNGRIMITPQLHLPNHPDIYVIGDMANLAGKDGRPLPGVAQVALQQGRYAAKQIKTRLVDPSAISAPFRYTDLGSMATIGRAVAVADIRGIRLVGFIGWLAWLFIHLMALVQFENRVLVLLQWAWNYITRNRAARLITGASPLKEPQTEPAS